MSKYSLPENFTSPYWPIFPHISAYRRKRNEDDFSGHRYTQFFAVYCGKAIQVHFLVRVLTLQKYNFYKKCAFFSTSDTSKTGFCQYWAIFVHIWKSSHGTHLNFYAFFSLLRFLATCSSL
jgi:hypothetical protein